MIKTYISQGNRDFVISSSGNAALAALFAVQNHNNNNPSKRVKLQIFVGNHIDHQKLELLQKELTDASITIEQHARPKQHAFQLAQQPGVVCLRQSTDDLALEGYAELAQDILKIPDLMAVFIPTSSGTAAQAIAETFLDTSSLPQVHIVQTRACHPIANYFDTTQEKIGHSAAGAIVDQIAHRKASVINFIEQTHGSGWIPTEKQIQKAIDLIKKHTDIDTITANGALGVAGLIKAKKEKHIFDGAVCCIVTGR